MRVLWESSIPCGKGRVDRVVPWAAERIDDWLDSHAGDGRPLRSIDRWGNLRSPRRSRPRYDHSTLRLPEAKGPGSRRRRDRAARQASSAPSRCVTANTSEESLTPTEQDSSRHVLWY